MRRPLTVTVNDGHASRSVLANHLLALVKLDTFILEACNDMLGSGVQQTHVGAATLGTATMETIVINDLAAVQALALWMDFLHGKLAAARERILVAKRLPSKVERLAHDLGHIPDTQRYQNGARGPRPTRRANHCIEYAVDNANLVHTDLLAIGRAIGETAVVLYTMGQAINLPISPLDSGRPMTVHLYLLANDGINMNAAYGTALLLMVIILAFNLFARFLSRKRR